MTGANDYIHRFRLFLLLVALMVGVYMLTYRALIQAGDTRRAFDAVTSYARYGDWLMDETNWLKLPFRIQDSDDLPLGEYDVAERLNILLATPLLRIAEAIPRLGNIHTVWLFNVVITALNAGLVYLILRSMSFSDRVAATVAASAGIGTNFWAYSQTFFPRAFGGVFHSGGAARLADWSWLARARPRSQRHVRGDWIGPGNRNQIIGDIRPSGADCACVASVESAPHACRRRCAPWLNRTTAAWLMPCDFC